MEEFKLKIQQIKDTRKKLIVERIDDRIATSNARLTTKMTNALSRMLAMLNKLKERSIAAKANGENTGALDAAIATAETAISNASAAVNTQAQNIYSANLTTDSALKAAIGQMVSGFRRDIQTTHKLVMDAKQAVMKALSEAASLGGMGNKNATGSALPLSYQ